MARLRDILSLFAVCTLSAACAEAPPQGGSLDTATLTTMDDASSSLAPDTDSPSQDDTRTPDADAPYETTDAQISDDADSGQDSDQTNAAGHDADDADDGEADTPDTTLSDASDAGDVVDIDHVVRASAWTEGSVGPPFPPRSELMPLPGGGEGGPVLTSNNPEEFTGPGLLYGVGRASAARGGERYPLEGDFGVYLHHLNRSGRVQYLSVLVTNPNAAPVTVQGWGSGYNQTETGGVGLGTSPDFWVSRDWLTGAPATTIGPATLQSLKPMLIWQKAVNPNAEVDGRFGLRSDAPVYVYVVATDTADINDAVNRALIDAPGDYRVSGTPPPPFGREAGVYAHDTWRGAWEVEVPRPGLRIGWMVNTATGAGFPQVQAFAALTHYDQSAAEAVGMYGNIYDLTLTLTHDGADANPRQVYLWFASLAAAQASRYWDGAGEVDGQAVTIQHTPSAPSGLLKVVSLPPGGSQTVHLRAMVPGLASIPQALYLESR